MHKNGFTVFLGIVLIAIVIQMAQASLKTLESSRRVGDLQEEIQDIASRNELLKQQAENLEEQYFIESQARSKLNFAREGETVVVVDEKKETINQMNDISSEIDVLKNASTLTHWKILLFNQ